LVSETALSAFCGECGGLLIKQYPLNYFNTSAMNWWCPNCMKYPQVRTYIEEVQNKGTPYRVMKFDGQDSD